ncbi:MAG: T9SS type A sorting domain-containing protein [Bacteroidota bacterium]|nr:T9SS type A sorting domain-containing protein [Bacteroidota bacterium]
MKHLILSFFFITLGILAKSQNRFDIIIGDDDKNEHPSFVFQNSDNDFIIGAREGSRGTGILIKLSNSGEVLLTHEWGLQDTIIFPVEYIQLENSFISISLIRPDSGHANVMLFTEYNYQFEILEEYRFIFPIEGGYFKKIHIIKNSNNNLVCAGSYKYGETDGAFIYKCTLKGDSINYSTYTGGVNISDIDEINDTDEYLLTGKGFFYYFGYAEIIKTDSNFNIDTVFTVHDPYNFPENWSFLEFVSDSTFLWYTKYYNGHSNSTNIITSLIDTSFNILEQISLNEDKDKFLPGFSWEFRNNTNIYIGANLIFDAPTDFILSKINSNLDVYWEKYYETDYMFFFTNILGTEDGGCLLLAETIKNSKWAIRAVKVDSDGSVNISQNFTAHETIVYPNPGSSQLKVRTAVQSLGGIFNLYTMSGKQVLQQQITNRLTELNTQNLPQGVYIFEYTLNNKVHESGKWILRR